MSEDTVKGSGQRLYQKARRLIPGGTQLLSKRPEMFLPEQWPSYYSKAKGVEVWDLDGKRYVDMSIMGVGACVLGYADPDVDDAVRRAIAAGSMCTLNSPEEVELAELLCTLHPWAEMVRYARSGGEILAIAIRIARAATGRDRIAFCGYHGWQDWYLAANLANDRNLDGHLLAGLMPAGVPRGLLGSALPFEYNRSDQLDQIAAQYGSEIAAIVMEPTRHSSPAPGFLQHARELANRLRAVLVFDEVTSGWRVTTGGIHLLYGINPDLAVFAKAMGNGYPISAVIGKAVVMEAAQTSFISSTNWTERIGPTAALATLHKHRERNAPAYLARIGAKVHEGWVNLAEHHGLKLNVDGLAPLSTFAFDCGSRSQMLHTLFTQEMLRRGFLASKAFYASLAHQDGHVEDYLSAVDEVFGLLSTALRNDALDSLLEGPVAHTGFRRLA